MSRGWVRTQPAVSRGLGSLRGFAAGTLGLIVLYTLGEYTSGTSSLLGWVDTAQRSLFSPYAPAIPWIAKGGPAKAPTTAEGTPVAASSAYVAAPPTMSANQQQATTTTVAGPQGPRVVAA